MKLAEYLARENMTITAFSKLSGVPRTTIYEIMAGAGTTASTAFRILLVAPDLELRDLIGDVAAEQMRQR
jgi:predicted transcriptional regulator